MIKSKDSNLLANRSAGIEIVEVKNGGRLLSLMERRKVGSSASLAERGLTVSTSAEAVHIAINGQDPKWRSTVDKNVEIRTV